MQKDQHKLRNINIIQALEYPFSQLGKTLVLPGGFNYIFGLLGVIISIFFDRVVIYRRLALDETLNIIYGVSFFVFYFPCLLGYAWQLVHTLRKDGYDTPAPDGTIEEIICSKVSSDICQSL